MAKKFIQKAIKHPGRMKRAAKRAGESTQEYMQEHKHDSGSLGKAARLGITLSHLHGSGPFSKSDIDKGYKSLSTPELAEAAPADCTYQDDPKYGRKSDSGPSGETYKTERPTFEITKGGGSPEQNVKGKSNPPRRGEAKQVAGESYRR